MGYYTRIFCTSDNVPSARQVFDNINTSVPDLTVSTNLTDEALAAPLWSTMEITYAEDRSPIYVECNHVDDENGLAREEIAEFLEEIGPAGLFGAKKKSVIQQLRKTKFIIASQLMPDIDPIGYRINDAL